MARKFINVDLAEARAVIEARAEKRYADELASYDEKLRVREEKESIIGRKLGVENLFLQYQALATRINTILQIQSFRL